MTTVTTNEAGMYEAAKAYQDIGFYIHPLKARNKIPIMNKWSEMDIHFTEGELKSHFYTKDPKNIGLICGKVSDCTIIDRDFIVKGIWEGLDSSLWVRQQRTDNRDHLFFRYCPDLQAKKYHALGFEILNNGNNCVLTPSIHPTGNKYQFTEGDPEGRPKMSKELIDRIKETITTFEALQRSVNNCRPVFRKFFKAYFTDNQKSNPHYRDMSIFHGASGRELTLYLFAELKANGATFEELVLLCKLIFLDEYDSADSEYQIGKIAAKATAKTETIKAHLILSQFYDASEDVTIGKQDQQSRKPPHFVTNEEPIREEIPEHIKARAREIAETGNPLDFILRTHQTLHVGDIGIAASLLLSATCQHVMNTDGIQPKLSGASGKGKSDCAKGMAHLIPQEWVITSSLSDKAIYYMGDTLRPGSILFCDDVALSEEMEKVINRATTFYQTGATHTTVDTNRKRLTLRIPARLGWWLTSIDDDQSLQTLNRTFGGEVDESAEQDIQVWQMQTTKALTGEVGLPLNDDVLTCREIIRDIKEQLYRVKIPFVKAIQWRDTKNRRNYPMFLDLIKALAVLRHRQRDIDGEECLIADLQDFVDAKQLYTSREQAQGTKLTASERKLCDILRRNGHEMTYQALAIAMGVGEDRITQILNGKGKGHDSGLKFKVTGIHVERRTEQNSKGGYTSKNYVMMAAGYDPLANYEEVVSIDYTTLPSYLQLTTNLPFKNTNGRRELTLLTLIESVAGNSNPSIFTERNSLKEITDLNQPEKFPSLIHSQKKGKFGKFLPTDSENEKVSSGNSDTESGQQIAKTEKGKAPNKKVSFEDSGPDISEVHKWFNQWEQVHKTKLTSLNYMAAAWEYARGHKIPSEQIDDVLFAVKMYAKLTDPEMCQTPAEKRCAVEDRA